ncbi:hypothetical protein Tco_0867525 [Tanacetum coccineum]
MDDPNITMEEYIRLEEEKAHRNGKVYNWEIATYARIWDDDEVHNLRSVETEFPTINPTMKITRPQHIDEFDLKDETSLSEYDEEEQNVLYFNDLFPFNIIYPNDLKSDKDNDDNEIDIIHSSGDFEERLGRIYGREIHRVQVFDFGGLIELMAEGLSGRMLMEHRDAQGQSFQLGGVRRRMSWREFILGTGLHTAKEIKLVGFGVYWAESVVPQVLHDIFPGRVKALRRLFASRRKREAMISRGQFVARLAKHFWLLTEERL